MPPSVTVPAIVMLPPLAKNPSDEPNDLGPAPLIVMLAPLEVKVEVTPTETPPVPAVMLMAPALAMSEVNTAFGAGGAPALRAPAVYVELLPIVTVDVVPLAVMLVDPELVTVKLLSKRMLPTPVIVNELPVVDVFVDRLETERLLPATTVTVPPLLMIELEPPMAVIGAVFSSMLP